jgi:putative hydrolase of the HAD superfamily
MVTAVVFDLDGTLFDDRQYVRAGLLSAAERLEARTGRDLSADLLRSYFRAGRRERTFDRVLSAHDLDPGLVPELVDAYHANEESLVAFPDATRVLSTLSDGYDLGLLTGGTNGEEKLRRLGLASHFDVVHVAAARGTSKWDAEPYEAILSELGVAASETAYVGDRPALDFPHPNRLGMHTIRTRTGRFANEEPEGDARPDVAVDSLGELPGVVSDLP